MRPHPFIVIEGIDASGKASITAHLAAALGARAFSFPDYTSPTGRALLMHLRNEWRANPDPSQCRPEGLPLNALVRQSMMTANRCEAHGALLAALDHGPVVADRYALSSLVYGTAEGLDPAFITRLSAPLLVPDLTIVLDIPIGLVAQRRPDARDANERNTGLLQRARDGYLQAAGGSLMLGNTVPGFGYVAAIDATAPLERVASVALWLARRARPDIAGVGP